MPEPLAEMWRVTHQACEKWLPSAARLHLSQIVGLEEKRQKIHALIGDTEKIQYWIGNKRFTGFDVMIHHKSFRFFKISLRSKRSSFQSSPFGVLFEIRCFESRAITRFWNDLIEEIMGRWSAVRAFQFDWDYIKWQNIELPSRYQEAIGPVPQGFKRYRTTQANNHTSEMERLDISLNPGRKVNPGRAVSANEVVSSLVTAETWLGPDFWEGAACT